MTPSPAGGFAHEVFFYADQDAFLEGTVPFVEEGLGSGEAVLVALPPNNLAAVQAHLPEADDASLRFLDMERVGRNPAWIIPWWVEFARPHVAAARRVRGIGEPIWSGRSHDELIECQRHEALLNIAFADAEGFTLRCPYDSRALGLEVLEQAARSHPHVVNGPDRVASDAYAPEIAGALDAPLSPPPLGAQVIHFGPDDANRVRQHLALTARTAGLSPTRRSDLVLVVSEATTNSVRHGGGSGQLALWIDGDAVVCEIRDQGWIDDRLAGRVRPGRDQVSGRGLWLIHQLCDLVQIRRSEHGQVMRLRIGPD